MTQVIYLALSFSAVPAGSYVSGGVLELNGTTTSGLATASLIEFLLTYVIVAQITNGVALRLFSGIYFDERPSARELLRFTIRRLPALIFLAVLYGAVVLIGFLFIVIPGIYLWGALAVVVPVLIVEGRGGFDALGRSQELVKGRWWATIGALLLGVVVTSGVALGLGALAGLLQSGVSSPDAYLLISALDKLIVGVLVTPISAAVAITIYFDLRIRKEGLDLELLSRRLGITAAPNPAAAAATAGAAFGA